MDLSLTDKTYIIVFKNNSKIFITQEQANKIKQCLQENVKWIEIGEHLKNSDFIREIIPSCDYEEIEYGINHAKKGDYYCERHTQWIPRGQTCGYC